MKNNIKRTLSFILAVLMLAGLLVPVTVEAQTYIREKKDKNLKESYTVIDDTNSNYPATGAPNSENEGEHAATDSHSQNLIDNRNQYIDESKEHKNKKARYISLKLINPGKINYKKGEALSHEGLLVEATDSNGNKKVLDYKGLLADKNINIQEISNKKSSKDNMENILIISAPDLDDIVINTYFHDEEVKSQKENSNLNLNPLDNNILEENKNLIEEKTEAGKAEDEKSKDAEKTEDEKVKDGEKDENELTDPEGIEEKENDPFMEDIFNLRPENELTEEELEAGLTIYQMPTVPGNKIEDMFPMSRTAMFRSPFMTMPLGLPGLNEPMGSGNGDLNLDGKKFTIITRYDISNENGPVKKGQSFTIHLDNKLKVNPGSTLPPIKYNNEVIATPEYNSNNTITYTLTKDINENIQVPINIPVDYNIDKITLDPDGTFTVINKVTGIGVNNPPKDLVPQKIDKNGNPAGSIIEPGRDDVTQIVDSSRNYRLDIDSVGNPVIENGEMVGINWVVQIESDRDLANNLGMKMNFTLVEGSGLKGIESITSSDPTEVIQDNAIKGGAGIVDSKHSTINKSTNSNRYSIYTPISNKQAAYVLDISTVLTKDLTNGQPYIGAVRSVMDKGYPKDKVEQHTPTRVGINNRTTIEGKFLSNTKAQWTITDGVCTLDTNNGLPLETRTLEGANINSGKRVVYGVDPTTGKMVVKEQEKVLNSIPAKEDDPNTSQVVGNIGVYQFTHEVDESKTPHSYTMAGVKISKFQDLYIDQEWNLPVDGMTMPAQKFIAKDDAGTQIAEKHVDAGPAGENQRLVVLPNARYWNIADDGTANKVGHNITQEFDNQTVTTQDGKTYKYNENANYYKIDTNTQYIHNSAIDTTQANPVTFTVVKVDSKDPSKKLAGATFKLLGDNQPEVVTDSQGKATFSNVLPGNYTLMETKAPAGYKLDQSTKTINITEDGKISAVGQNIKQSGSSSKTEIVGHDNGNLWPDYMNAMHYGKINDNGELEFYIYLKPNSDNGGNGTNRDTRLNISVPGVNITDVTAYDVGYWQRNDLRSAMEDQKADQKIAELGDNVINAVNKNKITGTANTTDPYTGRIGYQIYFPHQRFASDWGFLVKVKANVGTKYTVNLNYDWLTNEDTANQTNLTQQITLSKSSGADNEFLVYNEEFTKSPISATKFGDEFDAQGNRTRLQGAEFVLKDSKGNVIANKITNENGEANFGEFPEGVYRLEESQAPDGYQKNGVYFEVVVDDEGQVKYNPRFEGSIGTPQSGQDYYIEKGEDTGASAKATVTSVNQRLEYLENEAGDIGTKTNVWEAYSYESLKYHADITLTGVSEGSRFEIQFDRNLDFTQYFSDFPKIVIDGKEVATPYFNYKTNLLTYVFNKNAESNVTASINLRGIIPDKYFAKETGQYNFTIKVNPGQKENITGNPNLTQEINADYGQHHSTTGDHNQSYYFRDVYQKEDGKWYVTVLTYLNPIGLPYSAKTVRYNWMTTDYQGNRIAEWSGKGYEPLYELNDVKVYATDEATYTQGGVKLNRYMPLSMGIRPEQDPYIYHLLAHQRIDPNRKIDIRENDVTITYNPDQIKTSNKLSANAPLIVKTPKPNSNGGFVVEQTFKITDIEEFNKKWRAFYMNDGKLTSAFASKANINTAIGDQAGGEIPKYYREIVGLINNKYKPGSFKLTKYNEDNPTQKLQNATFALIDKDGRTIYRTSDANGEVKFVDIAPGRYNLEEVKAPDGYQITNKKWQVTILSDGSVRIRETSVTGESKLYTGDINIQVANKPAGQKFRVYKKDGNGDPLQGAKFKITCPDDPNFTPIEATSGQNGIVEFNADLKEGKNYILEEVDPPAGYNPLNKKWVLKVEGGETKVYNYSENTEGGQQVQSILAKDGVEWVDVKNRNTSNWSTYDNRWTGWAGNNQNAQFLGTRIVAVNKVENYVIQRYVINPEARNIADTTTASIHRQSTRDPNMDWFDMNKFDKNNDIKVFKLDKPVTGLISDIRLANYNTEDITTSVVNTAREEEGRYGEPKRLHLDLPATDKPIVIDIKVPYKDENGGVGTGMDWVNGNLIYWKSDYYEVAKSIKTTGPTTSTSGTIVGSYVATGSLDVTNNAKTYGFKLKKVKDGTTTAIPGAVFKLTGPEPKEDERYETTGDDGTLSFAGLEPGKYTLEEFKPAPGYENANTNWTVRITLDGKAYISDNKKNPEGTDPNVSFDIAKDTPPQKQSVFARTASNGEETPLLANSNRDIDELSAKEKLDLIYGTEVFRSLESRGISIREGGVLTKALGQSLYNIIEGTKTPQDGLEIGDEIVPEAQRAGKVVSYEILDTSSNQEKKYVKVDTDAQYLGNEEFLIRIDLYNYTQIDLGNNYPITFDLQLHSDVTFVPNSTISWKKNSNDRDQAPDNPSRWHTGYDPNTKTIGVRGGVISLNKGDTASIEFKVKLVKSLNTNGIANIFQNYKVYNLNVTKPRIKKIEAFAINKNATNGTIITNPIDAQRNGQPVTFTAKPNPGYKLVGNVTVTNDNTGSNVSIRNGNTFTMPASDVTINATFEAETYKITYNNPTGGTVSGPQTAKTDESVTLNVSSENGYKLKSLTVDGQDVTNGVVNNQYTFTMLPRDVSVEAVFEKIEEKTYNVYTQTPVGGTLSVNKTKAKANETITVTAVAYEDYELKSITYRDTAGNEHTVTGNSFTMPASDITVSATFEKKADPNPNYNVKVNPAENGQVTVTPTSAKKGETVTITASPSEGYVLDTLTVTDGAGNPVQVTNNSFTMPEGDATVSATFKKTETPDQPGQDEKEIKPGELVQITNKLVGLDLKIYKKDRYDRKLEGAIFNLWKASEDYKKQGDIFATGVSDKNGLVEFKNKDGKIITLPVGYYVIEETAAPLGYRKPNAPWHVQVVEENGKLVAKYKGPKETPQSFVEKNENLEIKEANGVKYATKITHIDTESRTFIQRVYIDTRGKNGVVNVQITPKHKREEIDRAGLPPVTIKEGVKTAYRSTYKITGLEGDPNEAQMIKILNDYDVSTPNVTVVNTARWRPFDWGFDEDQLNLEPGVYYIDIEGFYDTSIINRNVTNEVAIDSNYNFTKKDGVTPSDEPVLKDPYELTPAQMPDADLGKIDIDIKFFDGAREFQQLYITENNRIAYKAIKDENGKDEASYQSGADALRQWLVENRGETAAKNWANSKPAGKKYVNALGKDVNMEGLRYITGKIVPPLTTASSSISTSMDISSLYSSNATNVVPQEGLSVVNDAERYNITFSKHGKDYEGATEEEITKKRLEGAVFKLEKRVREGVYEELEGSYVSSAFNGYFGFRGLEPGRYRLVEVQAPKGYKPINGPLLYFSVETVSLVSQKIVDPRTGEAININDTEFYFPNNTTPYEFKDLEMHDPVTNKVIKFKDARNADLETTKIIDPTDPTKATEVSLKELSIKFPGEVKDKEGNVIKDTYKISEIQVTPTSNGYISLEYNAANGVYQYIPEKSTTKENGLLVDYVTSATAKNMGKIVNEIPGKGKVTINKVDENGDPLKATGLKAGAKFKLTNLLDGSDPVEKTVGEDGTLTFEGLKIGNYELVEIESPDGHINTDRVWHFIVGGKDLDPYAEDIANTGRNLSDLGLITLEKSEMSVASPVTDNKQGMEAGKIYPHQGESLEFNNTYKIADNTKINPGDYFVLQLSDKIDLHGVFENSINDLDIFADGVGTIARAKYDREAGTVTYTFTKYADTYELITFSNKIAAFINLDETKSSTNNVSLGMGINGDTTKYSTIDIVYDMAIEEYPDIYGNNINLASKIVKYNPKTGEFTEYFYLNRNRKYLLDSEFQYYSQQVIDNLVVEKYKLKDNSPEKIAEDMPESFGINENSSNLEYQGYVTSENRLYPGYVSPGDIPTMTPDDSYIIKITGRVANTDKSKYTGFGKLIHYYGNGNNLNGYRYDTVYEFHSESAAEANLTITAENPSNKIKFKKINSNSEALSGAIFQIYKKSGDNWNAEGMQPKTSDENGLFGYEKLGPGVYKIEETTAPEGYDKLIGPVVEFRVDKNGKVYRKEPVLDDKGKTQKDQDGNIITREIEEPGIVPITIVNDKEHEVEFKKVDANDKTPLEGAEFEVWYKTEKTGEYLKEALKLYEKTNADGTTERLVLKADETAPEGYTAVDKFTTGKDGTVKFKFKESGYFALKEVKAPKGYIKPKDFVKEFAVVDGKVQEEEYKTEMDVKKTTGYSMANDVYQKSYTTNMTLRFNPNHEDITYVKDKSTITLSDLPLKAEIWDNKFNAKEPISITAYLVDGDNKESTKKTFALDLTKDYDASYKASKTIDLYSLVKELEKQTTDGDIKSNKTLVLTMTSSLYLKSELDIKSNIVIGDKIKEDRTFHIGTKGDAYEEHSYTFTTMGNIDLSKPIEVENKKGMYPSTGGIGTILFTVAGAVLMTFAGLSYYRKRRKSYE